ncbi:hypothetical protein CTAYLR_002001 [Chrysophaeum taylorii]|uniref:CWH43-like N-terminal domain-containing protein n=1 Tax=Chrysophaeum taylorii TaxID=2483200 RepID=A0AAD7UA52_9STRA|nr:hypothetical protein CTAYLR_002001 [Chrysophaeum taylorii]
MMLAIIQLFLYFGDPSAKFAKVSLWMGLVGAFFLSWVGAICDDADAPSCMGNNTIHTTCAVIFFVLYDLKMLLNISDAVDATLCALSCAATASLVTSEWALAVVEWTDVALIMAWTLRQVSARCGGVSWCLAKKESVEPLWTVDVTTVTKATALFYFGTLAITAVVGLRAGYLPTEPGQLWYISDMWTQVPGNWISRWGVVRGAHFGWLTLGGLYAAADGDKTRRALLGIGMIALFGLSVVGCCNENENLTIHCFAAEVFFVGYDILMVGTFITSRSTRLAAFVGVSSHLVRSFAVFPSLAPFLEWTNALAIILFTMADVAANYGACKGVLVGVVSASEYPRRQRPKQQQLILHLVGDDDDAMPVDLKLPLV